MLKVLKKIFGSRGLFLRSQNLKNTIRGPNISLGTFNTVQYTLYVKALSYIYSKNYFQGVLS